MCRGVWLGQGQFYSKQPARCCSECVTKQWWYRPTFWLLLSNCNTIFSVSHSAPLPARRLGVSRRMGGDSIRTAGSKLPKANSKPYNIMFSNKEIGSLVFPNTLLLGVRLGTGLLVGGEKWCKCLCITIYFFSYPGRECSTSFRSTLRLAISPSFMTSM